MAWWAFSIFLISTIGARVFSDEIFFPDLMQTSSEFHEPNVTSYSQLLFDISRDQLFVGARDVIYRLRLETLEILEKALWLAPPDKALLCQDKGQPEGDCRNFIKVLLTDGKKLFTCGTNAFSPQCAWREMEEVRRVTEWVRGVGKCAYSPKANMTSILTNEGHYLAGSPLDFSGSDAAITRGPNYLRTNQYNSKWLNDPQFVGSFETEEYVYFIFRETAVEFINCGKIVYSRIGRVCKNDSGGQLMLRDNWTTFVKARLNCSVPGEFPFYYDNVQGISYMPDRRLIYATFTTPLNSITGSAICAFNMSSIEESFGGAFKHQRTGGSTWEREAGAGPRSCSASTALLDSSKYQLMDSAISQHTLYPIYTATLETLTHIAVDQVATKLHRVVDVLYVATVDGLVKKLSVVERTGGSCLLEVWHPSHVATQIHTLQFAADSVYIGTETGLMRVSKEHCRRRKSKASCLSGMDPHCGWDENKEICTQANPDPLAPHFIQDASQCPVDNLPVDGGWSAWSPWSKCQYGEEGDKCLCSTRRCENPKPERGGANCVGESVNVTNCTLHGAWAPWSSWSACSQSCGMAVKTRRRACANPAPAHGGRVCVGLDRQEMYCHSNPPCPQVAGGTIESKWSSWSSWGECTAKCGGGFRVRSRTCLGQGDCEGCHLDYQRCNEGACIESRKLSSWSSWVRWGGGSERRVRYACKAPAPDPSAIKISLYKTEERICTPEGLCTRSDGGPVSIDGWSEWSSWSPCSATECGEGRQTRVRTCDGGGDALCPGPSLLTRPCHAPRACPGEWSCWNDWGECRRKNSGEWARERVRECKGGDACQGPSSQTSSCLLPLEGEAGAEEWTDCEESCSSPPCNLRPCPKQLRVHSSSGVWCWSGGLWGAFIGIIIGIGLGIGGTALWRGRPSPPIPSSPHYISKQNPYVSVPLREVKRNSTPNSPDLDHDKFF